jgi:hypothetical protein
MQRAAWVCKPEPAGGTYKRGENWLHEWCSVEHMTAAMFCVIRGGQCEPSSEASTCHRLDLRADSVGAKRAAQLQNAVAATRNETEAAIKAMRRGCRTRPL